MDDSPITVSETELERALRVWVNQTPRRMWQDYFRCSETTYKWGGGKDPFDRFDPRHALARYLAEKFTKAGWTVTYPVPEHPATGEPLVHHRDVAEQRRLDNEKPG